MRRWIHVLTAVLLAAAVLWAVTVNGSLQVLGTLSATVVDFTSSTSTAPMRTGTSLPGACTVGQAFFKTDAAAGQNIHLCTADNTWTPVQGGGGAGAFDWKPSTRYTLFRTDFAYRWSQPSPAVFGDWVFVRVAGSQDLNNPRGTLPMGISTGVIGISTTTTSGNRSFWAAETGGFSSDSDNLYTATNRNWEFVVIFRWPDIADSTSSTTFLGMLQNSSDLPPSGLGVRHIAGTDSSLTYFATSAPNLWGSTLASGVNADTAWHKLRIRSDGTQTNRMWISLDGGTERSVCPSGCDLTLGTSNSRLWAGNFGISLATNEAAQKRIQLDYLHLWVDYGTER